MDRTKLTIVVLHLSNIAKPTGRKARNVYFSLSRTTENCFLAGNSGFDNSFKLPVKPLPSATVSSTFPSCDEKMSMKLTDLTRNERLICIIAWVGDRFNLLTHTARKASVHQINQCHRRNNQ